MLGRRGEGPQAGCAGFARLEPRLVLSENYLEFLSLEEISGVQAVWGTADGVSPDGDLIWRWPESSYDQSLRYIASRERLWTIGDLPLLEDASVAGITSAGTMLAWDFEGADLGRAFTMDLFAPDERLYLDERAIDLPAGFDFEVLRPGMITDAGSIFLHTAEDLGAGLGEVWLLTQEDASLLWTAPAERRADAFVQACSTGYAIGYAGIGGGVAPIRWSEADGIVQLENLEWIGAVGPDGRVAGKTDTDWVGIWENGLVRLTSLRDGPQGFGYNPVYFPRRLDGLGRMLVEYGQAYEYPEFYDNSVYDGTEFGIGGILIRLPGEDEYDWYLSEEQDSLTLGESGQVAGWGFYDAVDPVEGSMAVPGRAVAFGADGEHFLAYTNSPYLKSESGWGRSSAVYLSGSVQGSDWGLMTPFSGELRNPDLEYATYIEPDTGRTVLLVNDPNYETSTLFRRPSDQPPGGWYDFESRAEYGKSQPFHNGITAFITPDRRVCIAGMNDRRHLVLQYEWRVNGQWTWQRANLTEAQFDSRGQETPRFRDPLASFSTPWGAMNIVGLDIHGRVHAAWWSVQRKDAGWMLSDISAAAGAPKLVGNITAAVTPSGEMQVFGMDERGHVMELWWTPTSNRWHTTDLTALTGGPALGASRITASAMPWAGLSVVGKSADGEIGAYWWTPRTGWVAQSLSDGLGEHAPVIPGPLTYQVAQGGAQHIVGVDESGHVVDVYWLADGQGWRVQDLTERVLG